MSVFVADPGAVTMAVGQVAFSANTATKILSSNSTRKSATINLAQTQGYLGKDNTVSTTTGYVLPNSTFSVTTTGEVWVYVTNPGTASYVEESYA